MNRGTEGGVGGEGKRMTDIQAEMEERHGDTERLIERERGIKTE